MRLALAILLLTHCLALAQLGFNEPVIGGTNLIGWWPLNEGAGTNVTDRSGKGSSGVLSNSPAWDSGVVNYAIAWPSNNNARATNPTVLIYDNPTIRTFTTNGAFAWSVWVFLSNQPPSGKTMNVLGKHTAAFGGSGYGLTVDNISGLKLNFYKAQIADQKANCTLSTGVWNHLVVVQNWGAAPTYVSFYTNSVLVGSATNASAYASAGGSTNHLRFGFGDSTYSAAMAVFGRVCDVRLFNRALTTNEIKQLYNGGRSSQH